MNVTMSYDILHVLTDFYVVVVILLCMKFTLQWESCSAAAELLLRPELKHTLLREGKIDGS